jgi:hypothetical protein
MCFSQPKIPEPVRYQQSQDPTYRDATSSPSNRRGRRGTILASSPMSSGSTTGGAMGDTSIPSKRTVLGG